MPPIFIGYMKTNHIVPTIEILGDLTCKVLSGAHALLALYMCEFLNLFEIFENLLSLEKNLCLQKFLL